MNLELTTEQIKSLKINSNQIEDLLGQTIDERDYWQEKSTELAVLVSQYFSESIGEHSNLNCPVKNAIAHIKQRIEIQKLEVNQTYRIRNRHVHSDGDVSESGCVITIIENKAKETNQFKVYDIGRKKEYYIPASDVYMARPYIVNNDR